MSDHVHPWETPNGVVWNVVMYVPDRVLRDAQGRQTFPATLFKQGDLFTGWVPGWWESAHTTGLSSASWIHDKGASFHCFGYV